jgi:hypothetical protein
MSARPKLDPRYLPHLKDARVFTVFISLLGSFFVFTCMCVGIDELFLPMVYGVVAFWAGAGIVCRRRPHSPTKGDLSYLKFGLYLILLFSYVASPFIWALRGPR